MSGNINQGVEYGYDKKRRKRKITQVSPYYFKITAEWSYSERQ